MDSGPQRALLRRIASFKTTVGRRLELASLVLVVASVAAWLIGAAELPPTVTVWISRFETMCLVLI